MVRCWPVRTGAATTAERVHGELLDTPGKRNWAHTGDEAAQTAQTANSAQSLNQVRGEPKWYPPSGL